MNVLGPASISVRLNEPAIALINQCLGADVLSTSRDSGERLVVTPEQGLVINYRPKGLESFCHFMPQKVLKISTNGSVEMISPDVGGLSDAGYLAGYSQAAAAGVKTVIDAVFNTQQSSCEVSAGLRAALSLS